MKQYKKTSIILGSVMLFASPAFTANPPVEKPKMCAIQGEWWKLHSGLRESKVKLLIARDDEAGEKTATISIIRHLKTAEDLDIPPGYPKWYGEGVKEGFDGKLYCEWGAAEPKVYAVTAELCPDVTISVDVELVSAPKVTVNISSKDFDDYKKKVNKLINSISESRDAVTIDGEIKGSYQRVDYFQDGEQIGDSISLNGEISLGAKPISVKSKPLPLSGNPFLTIQFGFNVSALRVKVGAEGSYNECKFLPDELSGFIGGGAELLATAEVVGGYNDGENVVGLSIEGSAKTGIKFEGTMVVKGKSVVVSGSGGFDGVKAGVKVSFKVGPLGEVQFADGTVDVIDGQTEDLPEKVIYTLP